MNTEEVWEAFGTRLEGFITSRVGDRDLAKDLLQDIFIKIHLNSAKLNKVEKLSSWLFTITRNVIIDHFRSLKKSTDRLNEVANVNFSTNEKESELSINGCLSPFIKDLPGKYADALQKTSFEKMSQKDYAALRNISYGAAKSRVQRARKMVRDRIVDCCNPKTDVYGNVLSKEPCKNECDCA